MVPSRICHRSVKLLLTLVNTARTLAQVTDQIQRPRARYVGLRNRHLALFSLFTMSGQAQQCYERQRNSTTSVHGTFFLQRRDKSLTYARCPLLYPYRVNLRRY
jgi:hypothetical protein